MSRRTILPQLYGDLTHIHSYTTIVGDGVYMCVMYAIVDYEWKKGLDEGKKFYAAN